MSEEAPFLHDIIENPDDDFPRLVYADWLEEQGNPRGEFIRVQCELASISPTDPRYADLRARERRFLRAYSKGWTRELRKYVNGWTFERGFVQRIKLPTTAFLEHAETILSLAPVQCVHFLDVAANIEELIRCEHLAKLTGIDFSHQIRIQQERSATQLEWLLNSPNLGTLKLLYLEGNRLGRPGIEMLSKSAKLKDLEVLNVSDNNLADTDLPLLSESTSLDKLREISLRGFRLTDEWNYTGPANHQRGLERWFRQSETVDVGGNGLPVDSVNVLLEAASSAPLQNLSLERSSPLTTGRVPIFPQSLASRLQLLNVSSSYLDARLLESLLSQSRWENLTHLHLNNSPLSEDFTRVLSEFEHLRSLVVLKLNGTTSRYGEHSTAPLKDEGLIALSKAENLPRLAELELRTNKLTAKGLEPLLDSHMCEQLTLLDLSQNQLGDSGAALLLQRGCWKRLTTLDLRGNKISKVNKRRLRKTFGSTVRY